MAKNNLVFLEKINYDRNNEEIIPEIHNVIDWYKNVLTSKITLSSKDEMEINESVIKLININQVLEPNYKGSTTEKLINSIINNFTEESYNNFIKEFERIYKIKPNSEYKNVPFFALLDFINYIDDENNSNIEEYYNIFKQKVIDYHKFQKYSDEYLNLFENK